MASKPIRKIRTAQYITPFGIGAILDIGNESFVAQDISYWKRDCRQEGIPIKLNRLAYRLKVTEFRIPKTSNEFWNKKNIPTIPFKRFPEWLFCQSCRRLKKWERKLEIGGEIPRCDNPQCKASKALVPMRFVMACSKGHLQDVPWSRWAHSDPDRNKVDHGECHLEDQLVFKQRLNVGGGLNSLLIQCQACGAQRTLTGITTKDAAKTMGAQCLGKQPWEYKDRDNLNKCDAVPQIVQKGASNLYYPKTISALDIPIESNDSQYNEFEESIQNHPEFEELIKKKKETEGVNPVAIYLAEKISESLGCDESIILSFVDEFISNQNFSDDDNSEKIVVSEKEVLQEEWPILTNPLNQPNKNFSSSQEFFNSSNSYGLDKLIEKIILIHKLREVRVLRGFQRLEPNDDEFIPADLGNRQGWLPAYEVFGEGIFLTLSEDAISSWMKKNKSSIEKRIQTILSEAEKRNIGFLNNELSPRFILLHTFAHLMIRQLSFECGYSASSLRERIYCRESEKGSESMAGILIYTAEADSEGALGGLVRQGRIDRLIPTIITALERGMWCSADPVCRELAGQGLMGLNRAACHSCALISETSCVTHNTFLDRMLLISQEGAQQYGFFSSVMNNYWENKS